MQAKVRNQKLSGSVMVPGSKSHTIRAVMIAAMANGKSIIQNPLTSADCKSALSVAQAFGAECEMQKDAWIISGTNGKLKLPDNVIDCGNSGTTTYIACSMAATIKGSTIITGDAQIRRRPIKTLIESLDQTDAEAFIARPGIDAPPVVITGPMKAGDIYLEGKISPQVSGVLLSAAMLEGTTTVHVKYPMEVSYVKMTLDWMEGQGVRVEHDDAFMKYVVHGPQTYQPVNRAIPSDWSGVAFPLIGAVMTKSEMTIEGVDFNDVQGDKEIVDILIRMGADITKDEVNGRILIKGGKRLHGVHVDCKNIPDTLPALSVIGAYADGEMTLTGLEVVRLKETDRVAVMQNELRKMGVQIDSEEDKVIIKGGKGFVGAEVESHDDHRVAMALMMAGLVAKGETVVNEIECVGVSFPNFLEVMNNVGADIEAL
ncbi:3-phosphoshikimate 1-carboxyvinyltransferase [Acidaminobacter hydrogenoformans]|uniref:3-phosphoshikimate 1-carboxyvinyltransferase n=1 Tax=Acidaminobacter hydrogenoformans DSM 2784 TaxID=1120920 RepID=A0A1G5S415_9FIRM|nr:3-phosphoshikimate 1-carboxyvinyltransferase [Acidaminobacter hydrogenoformans]SCZ81063.1 3-phosphoshikimate 1-carboxyvinyltransferase [Acidaminobacter hydrogenoformans DSM 2784]